jgi:acetolactate synthase-1/2/3 large subunit
MKAKGSELAARALEDEGVLFTFGIPGTHNIELYDAIDRSGAVVPILVTDEQSASFMADGVSRTTGTVGVVNVVPGAGVTHCLSGVAEAFMDNVPMVVLACGVRGDTGRSYQLHDINQAAILKTVTKAVFRPEKPEQIYSDIREAFAMARSGAPGPVAVEMPADYYLLTHDVPEPQWSRAAPAAPPDLEEKAGRAAEMLSHARHPVLYLGNGARGAGSLLVDLAERGLMPVATTIQGKGVFPEDNPLWLWNGFGASAPPFVRDIMEGCDCLLAIGCRFGEVATASYGISAPDRMIHVDIDPDVFNRNYPAAMAVQADAAAFVGALLRTLPQAAVKKDLLRRIPEGHRAAREKQEGFKPAEGRISPHAFYSALQNYAGPDAVFITDSGNGTFYAMEHLRIRAPRRFLAPVDYSCMGYAVPAAIGAKLAGRGRDVIAIPGDGALLMTGLELLTAAEHGAGVLVCVLRDRELGQIAAFQRNQVVTPTCTGLADFSLEEFAGTVRCDYTAIRSDGEAGPVIAAALEKTRGGKPAIVEVPIDYGAPSYFNKGVVITNFLRFPWSERLRLAARFVKRKVAG